MRLRLHPPGHQWMKRKASAVENSSQRRCFSFGVIAPDESVYGRVRASLIQITVIVARPGTAGPVLTWLMRVESEAHMFS